MNVNGRTKIYKKDFNGKPVYSRSIASQEYKDGVKGDWIRTYEKVQMPKGADIADGSVVEITGFEAVYKYNGEVRRKLVVTEYNVLDAPEKPGFEEIEESEWIPF